MQRGIPLVLALVHASAGQPLGRAGAGHHNQQSDRSGTQHRNAKGNQGSTARALAWQPRHSHCESLPGFRPVDTYPTRSPLLLADYVISKVGPGGSVVEVGTRNGDVSECIARSIRKYQAVEMEAAYCRSLRSRGIAVLCEDFNKLSLQGQQLSDTDAFLWFVWPPEMSEAWLRRLWEHAASGKNMSVLVCYDTHIPEDMRYLPLLASHYGGEVERVFFDEGAPLTSRTEPSYAHPHLWRPGRWGVVHIAHFRLGPTAGPLPKRLRGELTSAIHQRVRTDWSWESFGWRPGREVPNARRADPSASVAQQSQSERRAHYRPSRPNRSRFIRPSHDAKRQLAGRMPQATRDSLIARGI